MQLPEYGHQGFEAQVLRGSVDVGCVCYCLSVYVHMCIFGIYSLA